MVVEDMSALTPRKKLAVVVVGNDMCWRSFDVRNHE
jgi:hypothetical protein